QYRGTDAGRPSPFTPRLIFLRATPVACDTAVIPPWPAVLASTAARRRRDRSFRSRSTAVNRSRITDVSVIQGVWTEPGRAGISPDEFDASRSHAIRYSLGAA